MTAPEPIENEYVLEDLDNPGNNTRRAVNGWPFHAKPLYRSVVEALEIAALQADLSDAAEFHGLLWMIVKLTPKGHAEIILEYENSQLTGDGRKSSSSDRVKIMKQNLSRWLNKKCTPSTLDERQRIIASCMSALKSAVVGNYAMPLCVQSDRKRCSQDGVADIIGLGDYKKMLSDGD